MLGRAKVHILKKGKRFKDLVPAQIEKGILMKAVKVKEIKSLLKTHSSVNWEDKPELQYLI